MTLFVAGVVVGFVSCAVLTLTWAALHVAGDAQRMEDR